MHNNEDIKRPTWDQVWTHVAHKISERSLDPRRKVGAVIISNDNTQVLALGYNGDHRGGPNEVESNIPGESGFIHAEINALIKLDFNNPKHKVMYITTSPCTQCAKAIINAQIDEVVYDQEYRDLTGVKLLQESGIQVRKIASE